MFILPGLYAPSVMSGSVGLHMNLPSLLAPCTFVFDEKWSHIVKPKTEVFFLKATYTPTILNSFLKRQSVVEKTL